MMPPMLSATPFIAIIVPWYVGACSSVRLMRDTMTIVPETTNTSAQAMDTQRFGAAKCAAMNATVTRIAEAIVRVRPYRFVR